MKNILYNYYVKIIYACTQYILLLYNMALILSIVHQLKHWSYGVRRCNLGVQSNGFASYLIEPLLPNDIASDNNCWSKQALPFIHILHHRLKPRRLPNPDRAAARRWLGQRRVVLARHGGSPAAMEARALQSSRRNRSGGHWRICDSRSVGNG